MNIKEKAYLDANFLIYWGFPKTPEIRSKVRILLAVILKKYNLFTSNLSFDETWWGIMNEYNAKFGTNLSCSDGLIFSEIENFTRKVLTKMEILKFSDFQEAPSLALKNIKDYHLEPRDAFHLAIMKDNEIDTIVTDDSNFINNQQLMNIKVESIF